MSNTIKVELGPSTIDVDGALLKCMQDKEWACNLVIGNTSHTMSLRYIVSLEQLKQMYASLIKQIEYAEKHGLTVK